MYQTEDQKIKSQRLEASTSVLYNQRQIEAVIGKISCVTILHFRGPESLK